MKLNLTEEQIKEIVNLRENTGFSWPKIGKQFDISGEDARRAYRVATGTREKAYTQQSPVRGSDNTTYEEDDNYLHIVTSSRRIRSIKDIVAEFNVDTDIWEVEKFICKSYEGYRKDRSVEWHVKKGSVERGDVSDSGKMLVVPLYNVEVRFIKRKSIAEAKSIMDDLITDARKHAPKYQKIEYPANDGLVYELDMQDIHFGRLTWGEESGEDYDIKIARKAIENTLIKLLAFVTNQSIGRIVIPLGNDFFNVDNKANTTTKGTPQQEDTRFQKTFRTGREICTWMIDTCSQIAPVDVLVIPGNHDETRAFFLGEALECWYHDNPNVKIDNRAVKQKYYSFGQCLIGFAHGADEKLSGLPLLMALDQPELWAKSKYREWHTGDKHHKADFIPKADESRGLVVRILRSLAVADAWTFNNGYRSLRASEGFLWHPEDGLIAQYTAMPKI